MLKKLPLFLGPIGVCNGSVQPRPPGLRLLHSLDKRRTLQSAVTTTDAEINRLVYELYGLTPEEIAIVEGA